MLRSFRAKAFAGVLLAGLLAMLAANLPGHLSNDSILQLYEGHMQIHETFGPVVYAQILALSDDLTGDTGPYVVVSGLLLTAGLISLLGLRPRASILAVALAAGMVLTPTLLIYQAIVWKDVLFANLAVTGFIALAHAAKGWDRPAARWSALLGAVALMAVAISIRQNGLVAALAAAVVVGWTARRSGPWLAPAYGAGWLAAVVLLAHGLGVASQPKAAGPDQALNIGVRILQHYDIVAAVALDPSLPLDDMDRVAPESDDMIRANAAKVYSPERVDFFDRVPELAPHLWPLPAEAISAQWKHIILERPDLYLRHRLAVFQWLFAPPDLNRCLPVYVGVTGPPEMLKTLGLTAGEDRYDAQMLGYARKFMPTPLYSHLTYAAAAVLVAGLLLLRRDPADWAVIGLQLAALGFTASFFVISIACDYRYLYFLDLSAMAGLLYAALDPPWRRKAA